LPANRTDGHVEGVGTTRERLADVPETKNAKRLAGELGPQRRRRRSNRPLALPFSGPQLLIDSSERARQSDHRSHDILGNTRLVSVGIGERQALPVQRAVDAIEAGAGHLHEAQAPARSGHRCVEPHGDENVGVGQFWQNGSLVAGDNLARYREPRPHGLGQPHGK
jgi:hypothetical protein